MAHWMMLRMGDADAASEKHRRLRNILVQRERAHRLADFHPRAEWKYLQALLERRRAHAGCHCDCALLVGTRAEGKRASISLGVGFGWIKQNKVSVLPRLEGEVAPARIKPECHGRSEEHTSELQSRGHLVCRLLLEKKNIE